MYSQTRFGLATRAVHLSSDFYLMALWSLLQRHDCKRQVACGAYTFSVLTGIGGVLWYTFMGSRYCNVCMHMESQSEIEQVKRKSRFSGVIEVYSWNMECIVHTHIAIQSA